MNHRTYLLGGLGLVVLVGISITAAYVVPHLASKTWSSVSVTGSSTPSIATNEASCVFPQDAATRYYSITVRTLDAQIIAKQHAVEDLIVRLGGSVSSTYQDKVNDSEAGYSDHASVAGSVPINQTEAFISGLQGLVTSPEYLEKEHNNMQNSSDLTQSCTSIRISMDSYTLLEKDYANQLSAGTTKGGSLTSLTQELINVRQQIAGLQAGLNSTLSKVGTTQITVDIRVIPG